MIRDFEVRGRLRPEQPSEWEKQLPPLGDTEFQIFRHKLETIAFEGKETAMRLGASAAMRAGDVGFGIYTVTGDTAICATGIWFHTVLVQIPLKYIIKHFQNNPNVGVHEGDAFFCNDPFYMGVHTSDMGIYMPVFHEGELVCWTACVVHSGDSGGREPGGMPLIANSRYDDGMHFPPVKIVEKHRMREDILHAGANMVRDPRSFILDVKARIAACNIGRKRMKEVIEKKGKDYVMSGLRQLIDTTADSARQRLLQLNDGTYRQPRFFDTVGPEDALLKIDVTLTKKEDRLHIDLTGTSPEVAHLGCNCMYQGILGMSIVYLCSYLFWDLPANAGLFEVLDWEFPENTVVSAGPETSTSMAPMVMVIYEHGLSQAGAKMLYSFDPKRSVAAWFKGFNAPFFGGFNQHGDLVADITGEMNGGGLGARSDLDGVNVAGAFFATVSDIMDVEDVEAEKPFLYLFRRHFRDAHGFGKYRGGTGLDYALKIHNTQAMLMGCFGYGSHIPSTLGLFGGYAIPTFLVTKLKGSNLRKMMSEGDQRIPHSTEEMLTERSVEGTYEFNPLCSPGEPYFEDDLMVIAVGGGGGYGDVLERDPEAVMEDIRNEITSRWAAKNVYKIVFDEESLIVDEEKTRQLREQERQKRLKQGKTYDEFMKDWSKRKPEEHIIRYYGSWPDPSVKEV
jgi:N-methylhydantoinase B/oxoprolinase/acetone carboxylase alpha subunit